VGRRRGAREIARALMRIAPADILAARVTSARAALAAAHLDALIVTNLANVAYLSGFFASAAALLVRPDRVVLIGDGRYSEALKSRGRECSFIEIFELAAGASYDQAIAEIVSTLPGWRVGFEAAHLTVNRHRFLSSTLKQRAGASTLVDSDRLLEQLRACKDAWEIARLREGAARLSEVAKCILPKVFAGRTEAEVAVEIEGQLRSAGFERPAFDTIIASGPNAAAPHARAGSRRIEDGDLVVVDFGGVLDGYCTDLTRTIAVGRAAERQRRVIECVIDAQLAAFAAVGSGGAPEDVDAAARETLTRHGMGDAFTHGTGHGLGLEVHEAPRVTRARPDHAEPRLAAGMVMTLEPGAYFPGWGGVRIEDDVLVTADGAEWLTDVPRIP
jgi:Xaa-Pro aminopeptidase